VHFRHIVEDTLSLLKALTLNIVPFSQDSSLEGVPGGLVARLARLRELNIGYLQAGDAFIEQDLPVPTRIGEYEILRTVEGRSSVVTHFEGALFKLHSHHCVAGDFNSWRYRRPSGCRRRWFPRAGWRWYLVESQPSTWSRSVVELLQLLIPASLVILIAFLYDRPVPLLIVS
jgi:hypothetical protein